MVDKHQPFVVLNPDGSVTTGCYQCGYKTIVAKDRVFLVSPREEVNGNAIK